MLLTPDKHLVIILDSIKEYKPHENDIAILIVEKISKEIINSVNTQISTQDIYDEVEECFNFYNDFVKEKQIDLDKIDDEFYELVKQYLNIIVEGYNEDIKENIK